MAEATAETWELIEAGYRAGIKSLRQLAGEHGITEGAIRKRSKRDRWTRDLSAQIAARTEVLVRREAVRTEGDIAYHVPEHDIIEANAALQAGVIRAHRKDIRALRDKANEYRMELDSCADDLGRRTTILKALADIQKTAIGLERQAFGIADSADGDAESGGKAIATIIRKIVGGHD